MTCAGTSLASEAEAKAKEELKGLFRGSQGEAQRRHLSIVRGGLLWIAGNATLLAAAFLLTISLHQTQHLSASRCVLQWLEDLNIQSRLSAAQQAKLHDLANCMLRAL